MRIPLINAFSLLMAMCFSICAAISYAQTPSMVPTHLPAYYVGDTQAIGNGVVYSWVLIDTMNHPISLGISFTESALANLPENNTNYELNWPAVPMHAPFDHFSLDWLPKGHDPTQFYGVPHFDFHFYLITQQAQGQITGFGADTARLNKVLPAQYIPQGYQPAYPAVALMGLHWIRPDFPEFTGHPFTESLLFGSYNGKLSFIEPMITLAFLQTKTNVDKPIFQPKSFQTSGYYPTRYIITHDAARHLYTVALVGLTYREAK